MSVRLEATGEAIDPLSRTGQPDYGISMRVALS